MNSTHLAVLLVVISHLFLFECASITYYVGCGNSECVSDSNGRRFALFTSSSSSTPESSLDITVTEGDTLNLLMKPSSGAQQYPLIQCQNSDPTNTCKFASGDDVLGGNPSTPGQSAVYTWPEGTAGGDTFFWGAEDHSKCSIPPQLLCSLSTDN
jgi:hypothetical protein